MSEFQYEKKLIKYEPHTQVAFPTLNIYNTFGKKKRISSSSKSKIYR